MSNKTDNDGTGNPPTNPIPPPPPGSGGPGGTVVSPVGNLPISPGDGYFTQGLQQGSTTNVFFRPNMRFQGERESFKFHLPLQSTMMLCASNFMSLRSNEIMLMNDERSLLYPTDAEISALYHIEAQLKFKIWALLKDADLTWFV